MGAKGLACDSLMQLIDSAGQLATEGYCMSGIANCFYFERHSVDYRGHPLANSSL